MENGLVTSVEVFFDVRPFEKPRTDSEAGEIAPGRHCWTTVSKTVVANLRRAWPNCSVLLAFICVDIVVTAPQQSMQIQPNNTTTFRRSTECLARIGRLYELQNDRSEWWFASLMHLC